MCTLHQKLEVIRHNECSLGSYKTSDARLEYIYIDSVGPLPDSNGSFYIINSVDRSTWWSDAVPTKDITDEAVAHAIVEQ